MEFIDVVGWAAIGLSSCFYLSLAIPFFHVLRCKLNFEYTPIALVNTIYVDCVSWYIYGTKLSCDQIILGHKIGACCSLVLICIYLAFELRKYLVDSILNCLILILGTLVIHKGLTIVIEDADMIGKVCIGTKVVTFIIPIILTFRVIKEKNYRLISFSTTTTYMMSCIGWVLFGKASFDINIMIPNCIGVVLCFIQFLVYLNFKKKYPTYSGPSSTIGIESGSTEYKKDESTTMNIDEESQEKAREKPVKIVTRIDN